MPLSDVLQTHATQPADDFSYVVVADVRGSTQAVKAGKQRHVNLVGAACIAAIRNAFPIGTIPYVFGGDGATFLVAAQYLERVNEILASVQVMARAGLNLSLRVGSVSVAELRSHGKDVRVGVLTCGSEEQVFVLNGDGLPFADEIVKKRDSGAVLAASVTDSSSADLQGLSCRLLPFQSLRGSIYNFIIETTVAAHDQANLVEKIRQSLKGQGEFERFRPLQHKNINRSWLPKTWLLEARFFSISAGLLSDIKKYLRSMLENLMTTFVFKFNKANSMTGLPSHYTEDMLLQCDWMKMNGALYLTLDMTDQEARLFIRELDSLESQGKVHYGMHRSSSALVVCHLKPEKQKQHFHFVDGSEGGLTLAATQLKEKKKRLSV